MAATAILKLQRAGFTQDQVEALAEYLDTQAVTKADLREEALRIERRIDAVEHELGARIDKLAQEMNERFVAVDRRIDTVEHSLNRRIDDLENRINQLEQRLTIRLGGMMVVAVGVVAALVKLL